MLDQTSLSSSLGSSPASSLASPPGDYLSDVLRELHPRGASYGHCLLGAPWGVALGEDGAARLHLVVAGTALFRSGEDEWIELGQGDLVFLPRGAAHALADSRTSPLVPLQALPAEPIGELTFRLQAGGEGPATVMACCSVRFDEPVVHPILHMMPAAYVVRQAVSNDLTLPALINAMADEVMKQRIGASSMLSRLADTIVVRLIRTWVEDQDGARTGWIAAMEDRRIGRVLVAMHRAPGTGWNIDALARLANMSRSAFHARFTALLGTSPLRYLANWRMQLASSWLAHGRMPVSLAAQRLGYESDAAFSRAFKRETGLTPGHVARGEARCSPSRTA